MIAKASCLGLGIGTKTDRSRSTALAGSRIWLLEEGFLESWEGGWWSVEAGVAGMNGTMDAIVMTMQFGIGLIFGSRMGVVMRWTVTENCDECAKIACGIFNFITWRLTLFQVQVCLKIARAMQYQNIGHTNVITTNITAKGGVSWGFRESTRDATRDWRGFRDGIQWCCWGFQVVSAGFRGSFRDISGGCRAF